jgi:hypothetical protein
VEKSSPHESRKIGISGFGGWSFNLLTSQVEISRQERSSDSGGGVNVDSHRTSGNREVRNTRLQNSRNREFRFPDLEGRSVESCCG